ncbi:hypothetical protein L1987_07657 [Smallanthus sonchifolius]|uniref:Uncharacterized protein n=1 Tax=Smallanthus sonchifolius TaxID=185202 RepID=A0ACB9K0Y9_9ASTR|nr:hypothetical protein L1987_07657 [Smallanthus sonchifolius]
MLPSLLQPPDLRLNFGTVSMLLSFNGYTTPSQTISYIQFSKPVPLLHRHGSPNIFQDNEGSRAVYLEHKLVTTKLDSHPNIFSYCQTLKMLADQLSNVGAPVSNQRLVLQLIAGLNDSYENVAMMIQQTTPLPEFYEARSKLILEETRKSHQAANSAHSALHVSNQQSAQGFPNWAFPPCPYPTQQTRLVQQYGSSRQFGPNQQYGQGNLGNRQNQAYAASEVNHTPTDLE